MTLRSKVLLISVGVAVLTLACGYVVVGHYVLPRFAAFGVSDVPQDVALRIVRSALLYCLASAALVFAAVAAIFGRSMGKDIRRLSAHYTALDETDVLQPPPILRRRDEIGRLAEQLDSMVRRFQKDIREAKQTERAVREKEERYALAMNAADTGLWDWDLSLNRVFFTAGSIAMLGYEPHGVTLDAEEWVNRIHPDDRADFRTNLDAHVSGRTEVFQSEHRVQRKDNSFIWVLYRGMAVRGQEGKAIRVLGLQSDITRRKETEEELKRGALCDTLTGLANRLLVMEQLELDVRRLSRRKGYVFALLFLDLDGFKIINDGLGHLVGDELLKAVANKLRSSVRSTDTIGRCDATVARVGGDEFVIILDEVYDVTDPIRVAERIHRELTKPFNIGGHEIFTSTSIGIAVAQPGLSSAEDLLRHADTALYRAKASGRACYAVFDMGMEAQAKKRLQLETDLRRAVERQEFMLHYQPIVDLVTGKIESFEALMRWHHPELGIVPVPEFIHIAEETGMILPMGRWVLSTACSQAVTWQQRFPHASKLGISVNMSAKEFLAPDFLSCIKGTLTQTGLDPECLRIEVTENVLMRETDEARDTLKALRALGVHLSIDDFGTGYSSLSYLNRFPVSNVKIDLSFVSQLQVSAESLQLVKTILALAGNLQLSVTAEGIATQEQLGLLRELQCGYGQGYLFSKPMDASSVGQLLTSDPKW